MKAEALRATRIRMIENLTRIIDGYRAHYVRIAVYLTQGIRGVGGWFVTQTMVLPKRIDYTKLESQFGELALLAAASAPN